MTASTELRLDGVRSTPLAGYLKALGLLRLVGEQLDPGVTGWWDGTTFQMGGIDLDSLTDFLLNEYRPTPIISPWNKASGCHPSPGDKEKSNRAALDRLDSLGIERLTDYVEGLRQAREVVGSFAWSETGSTAEKEDQKRRLVTTLRNRLPDDAVTWIDCTVVLGRDRSFYPPFLGSGGNIGPFDVGGNFAQRLLDVITSDHSFAWLSWATAGRDLVPLLHASSSQLDPGATGRPSDSESGPARALANPWDIVLSIEGSVGLAASIARRSASTSAQYAGAPFCTTASVTETADSKGQAPNDADFWAPIWGGPATWAEVRHCLAEGRSTWNSAQAATGTDFARAVATLGVDRGIGGFQRFLFTKRNGDANLAVPAGQIWVKADPEIELLAELDPWLLTLRRTSKLPASVTGGLQRMDRVQFRAATQSTAKPTNYLAALLTAVELESIICRGTSLQKTIGPIPMLSPAWLDVLDDGSWEYSVARGVASAYDQRFLQQEPVLTSSFAGWSRGIVRTRGTSKVWAWKTDDPAFRRLPAAASNRAAAMVSRRLIEAGRQPDGAVVNAGFDRGAHTSLDALSALVMGLLDISRVRDLIRALSLIDPQAQHAEESSGSMLTPPLLAATAPFFCSAPVAISTDNGPQVIELCPEPAWSGLLKPGRLHDLARASLRRMAIAGLPQRVEHPVFVDDESTVERLSTAFCCRLTPSETQQLLRLRAVPRPATVEHDLIESPEEGSP